ncbi:MAG: N-acetylmuramoyl-L-alanine amidase [Clostridiaceae bacterium]|nr:N-acetylmuramoyl-L-alanine amidase [Clostridiaceae bacterium]
MGDIVPKIKVDYIPEGNQNRPGTKGDMQWITIHNTANPNSTAQNERDYVARREDNVGFHYAVDDQEAIAIIPEDEVAWHTGTREGNRTSIGIEICESGDQKKTWQNAVGLTAKILKERGWKTDRIRTHKSWSGKNCPRKLLDQWDEFTDDIENALEILKNEDKKGGDIMEKPEENTLAPEWKLKGIQYLQEKGLLYDIEGWTEKVDEPMPVWAVTLLLKRIHEDLASKDDKKTSSGE